MTFSQLQAIASSITYGRAFENYVRINANQIIEHGNENRVQTSEMGHSKCSYMIYTIPIGFVVMTYGQITVCALNFRVQIEYLASLPTVMKRDVVPYIDILSKCQHRLFVDAA